MILDSTKILQLLTQGEIDASDLGEPIIDVSAKQSEKNLDRNSTEEIFKFAYCIYDKETKKIRIIKDGTEETRKWLRPGPFLFNRETFDATTISVDPETRCTVYMHNPKYDFGPAMVVLEKEITQDYAALKVASFELILTSEKPDITTNTRTESP